MPERHARQQEMTGDLEKKQRGNYILLHTNGPSVESVQLQVVSTSPRVSPRTFEEISEIPSNTENLFSCKTESTLMGTKTPQNKALQSVVHSPETRPKTLNPEEEHLGLEENRTLTRKKVLDTPG